MRALSGKRGAKSCAAKRDGSPKDERSAKGSEAATGGAKTRGGRRTGKARSAEVLQKAVARLTFEEEAWKAGHRVVAGVDEAGRGPLAGPVVAAAVVLDTARIPDGIADSKTLTAERREALFDALLGAADIGIAISDVEQIDRENILAATLDAMRRAVGELKHLPSIALVDGNQRPQLTCECRTIVKGDLVSLSIAAASIVAKVSRDRMMMRLDALYPGYGFASHKGYGTAEHHAALSQLGVSPLHRRSFKPVRDILETGLAGAAEAERQRLQVERR